MILNTTIKSKTNLILTRESLTQPTELSSTATLELVHSEALFLRSLSSTSLPYHIQANPVSAKNRCLTRMIQRKVCYVWSCRVYIYENSIPLGLNGSFSEHEGREDRDHSSAQVLNRMPTNNMMRPAIYGVRTRVNDAKSCDLQLLPHVSTSDPF